jgi:hypothetical protein
MEESVSHLVLTTRDFKHVEDYLRWVMLLQKRTAQVNIAVRDDGFILAFDVDDVASASRQAEQMGLQVGPR